MAYTKFGTRLAHPIGGNHSAQGGLWRDLPLHGLNSRDAFAVFNDFNRPQDYDNTADWTQGVVGTPGGGNVAPALIGEASVSNTFYGTGFLTLTTGTTASTGYGSSWHAQTIGHHAPYPKSGRVIGCEWAVSTSTATGWTATSWYFGLAEAATTVLPLAATGVLGASNYSVAGFHHLQSVGNGIPLLKAAGADGTVVTATPFSTPSAGVQSTSTVDGTKRFGVRIEDGTKVYYFIDGVYVGGQVLASAYNANQNSALAPAFSVVTAGTSSVFRMDYVALAATR